MAAAVPANSPQGIQPTRDSHTDCALAVQYETEIVVEFIKSRSIMNRSEWANPLIAAPSAVCIMAILLKTASSTVAAGLPLRIRAITDAKGEKIGELQSTLLHGGLQSCSDLGRNAFSEARNTMDYVNKVALNMIQNNGKIENILRMIEPSNDEDEDVADDLTDEMNDIGKSVSECLHRIQKLTKEFHYWYWVICIIKENVIGSQGEIQEKANQNELDLNIATITKNKHNDIETTTLKTIKELEIQLEDAKNRVKKAEELIEKLANLPPITEPSRDEELLRAENAIPIVQRKTGIIRKVRDSLKGESKEKFAARQDQLRDIEARRNEYIKGEKKKRDEAREAAERALKRAREYEEELRVRINNYIKDLNENRDLLANAQANLEETKSRFEQLKNTRAELADILTTLVKSASRLGELKEQVHDLNTFLNSILNDVTVTVEDVKNEFLRRLQKGIRVGPEEQFQKFKLSKNMQKRVHDSALRIQASFCAIRDISSVYVTISDRYIIEAINRMETLSYLQGEEWEIKRVGFFEWCDKSKGEIQGLTETVTEKFEENMKERVARLAQLVIEPAH